MTTTPTTLNGASAPWRGIRRMLRGIGRTLATLLGLIVILTPIAMIYESTAEAADMRAYPPPGQMVDVGGYRLHINCTGIGSPTVIMESGWGDAASWGWVQPAVAKTTRICTYDRAGMGWSEASPQPRMARAYAKELHTLLANANEPGPYVLAGHSMGGFTLIVYAHDYPGEVSGLVLIDSQDLPTSDVATPQAAPKPGGPSLLPALLARIGLIRLLAEPLGAVENLPEGDKQAYTAFAVAPRGVQTILDEVMGMSEGGAQARAVTSLGGLPLIVLSRGKDQDAKHTAAQFGLLQLSSNSAQLFADQSGHSIMIDQPEAAVAAIVQMVLHLR